MRRAIGVVVAVPLALTACSPVDPKVTACAEAIAQLEAITEEAEFISSLSTATMAEELPRVYEMARELGDLPAPEATKWAIIDASTAIEAWSSTMRSFAEQGTYNEALADEVSDGMRIAARDLIKHCTEG